MSARRGGSDRAKLWCAALVTWGVAAVGGMGLAVYYPSVLPSFGNTAAARPVGPVAPGAANPTGKPLPTKPAVLDTAPGARQRAADKAVDLANAQGWRTGIAIIDLENEDVTTAGDAQGYFAAQSTMKLFIAARLLEAGAMTPARSDSALEMIARSSDPAASSLYSAVGGDDLVTWISAQYGIAKMGTKPTRGKGEWGSTQVTPLSMAKFLVAARKSAKVSPWLMAAMGRTSRIAADGTNQVFGLLAADANAHTKQGWGGSDGNPDNVEGTPSVGYVVGDRYAVAIYTSKLPEVDLAAAQAMVTAQARLLLPAGQMPVL